MANKDLVAEAEKLDELFQDKDPNPAFLTRKYACTVVNLLPKEIFEEKPHMLPSSFKIPAAPKYGDLSVLHVEEGIHWVPDAFVNRSIKQVTVPSEMARSIVDDYVNAHICLAEDCKPGLFWVENRLTAAEVKKHHTKLVRKHAEMQDNWFHALCNMADADWQKNHNMLAVSDLQRIAAQCLGIDKEWAQLRSEVTVECPFCKFRIAPDSVKCLNCKEIVNKAEYDRLIGVK